MAPEAELPAGAASRGEARNRRLKDATRMSTAASAMRDAARRRRNDPSALSAILVLRTSLGAPYEDGVVYDDISVGDDNVLVLDGRSEVRGRAFSRSAANAPSARSFRRRAPLSSAAIDHARAHPTPRTTVDHPGWRA